MWANLKVSGQWCNVAVAQPGLFSYAQIAAGKSIGTFLIKLNKRASSDCGDTVLMAVARALGVDRL
jgi:hypothetical protein